MAVTQTITFNAVSIAELATGTITAFLYSGNTLIATLSGIGESGLLRGRYAGTVTDVPTATYRLVVKFNGITISEAEYSVDIVLETGGFTAYMNYLAFGTPVFGHSYMEALKRIEICSGAASLSGAGTGTEVMTSSDGTRTATFIVDTLGNVSSVTFN